MSVRSRHAGLDPASRDRGCGLDSCFRRNDGPLQSIVIFSRLETIVAGLSEWEFEEAEKMRPASREMFQVVQVLKPSACSLILFQMFEGDENDFYPIQCVDNAP